MPANFNLENSVKKTIIAKCDERTDIHTKLIIEHRFTEGAVATKYGYVHVSQHKDPMGVLKNQDILILRFMHQDKCYSWEYSCCKDRLGIIASCEWFAFTVASGNFVTGLEQYERQ